MISATRIMISVTSRCLPNARALICGLPWILQNVCHKFHSMDIYKLYKYIVAVWIPEWIFRYSWGFLTLLVMGFLGSQKYIATLLFARSSSEGNQLCDWNKNGIVSFGILWLFKSYPAFIGLVVNLLNSLNHCGRRKDLTHWGRDKMAAISQTTLSNAFSWMKL